VENVVWMFQIIGLMDPKRGNVNIWFIVLMSIYVVLGEIVPSNVVLEIMQKRTIV